MPFNLNQLSSESFYAFFFAEKKLNVIKKRGKWFQLFLFLLILCHLLSSVFCCHRRGEMSKCASYSITFWHFLWCFIEETTLTQIKSSSCSYEGLKSKVFSRPFLRRHFYINSLSSRFSQTAINFYFQFLSYLSLHNQNRFVLHLIPDLNSTTDKFLFPLLFARLGGNDKKLRINRIEFIWCVVGVFRQETKVKRFCGKFRRRREKKW